jgi:hypothetical protein
MRLRDITFDFENRPSIFNRAEMKLLGDDLRAMLYEIYQLRESSRALHAEQERLTAEKRDALTLLTMVREHILVCGDVALLNDLKMIDFLLNRLAPNRVPLSGDPRE